MFTYQARIKMCLLEFQQQHPRLFKIVIDFLSFLVFFNPFLFVFGPFQIRFWSLFGLLLVSFSPFLDPLSIWFALVCFGPIFCPFYARFFVRLIIFQKSRKKMWPVATSEMADMDKLCKNLTIEAPEPLERASKVAQGPGFYPSPWRPILMILCMWVNTMVFWSELDLIFTFFCL